MSAKLQLFLEVLSKVFLLLPKNKKGGKPVTHSHASFVLFFMIMYFKKIYEYQAMERYLKVHYKAFGFSSVPSRKTIQRRKDQLPNLLSFLIPNLAKNCANLNRKIFGFSFGFVDKSVFRALGGLWHKKDMQTGRVPHPSIDTEASWAKSAYHGWRFGYGLHLICNKNRFPISACVTTASVKDYNFLERLIEPIKDFIGVVIGDSGYFCLRNLQRIYENWDIFVQTPKIYENITEKTKDWFKKVYNDLVQTSVAQRTYLQRKPSVEPCFALIKELFDLTQELQLPFKGLKSNETFLMMTVLCVQLLMYDNFKNGQPLQNTDSFLQIFR
ncbi:MAG: hypothetical protein RLZZ628_2960 [Bacteroidota bacterium]|jgi:hypothetical protein